jgi:hypothetical protein
LLGLRGIVAVPNGNREFPPLVSGGADSRREVRGFDRRRDRKAWQSLLRFLGAEEEFEPIRHHYNDTKEEQATRPIDDAALTRLSALLADEVRFYRQLFASEEERKAALAECWKDAESFFELPVVSTAR